MILITKPEFKVDCSGFVPSTISGTSVARFPVLKYSPESITSTSIQLRDILIGKANRNDSERISVAFGSFDTPISNNSHGSEDGYDKLKDLELVVKAELAGHMYRDENFGKNAFVGQVVSKKDIEEFLLECNLYDSNACRWRDIPEKLVYESELYDPIGDNLEAAIDQFYPSSDSNPPNRIVFDSHTTQLHRCLDP